MKKIYLLAAALFVGFSANAQLTDSFENYPLGSYFGGHWTNWDKNDVTNENIFISDDYASDGVQSGYIGGNGLQDPILDVGQRTSGVWSFSMDIYIEFFASGYFNAQGDLNSLGVDGNWMFECYIGLDPTQEGSPQDPGMIYLAADGTAYTFEYPEEEWFNLGLEIDLDNDVMRIFVNGEELIWQDQSGNIVEVPYGPSTSPFLGKLAGFDYYSADPSCSMYIDRLNFYEGEFQDNMAVKDLANNEVSVYPTVTKDLVNVTSKSNIDNITVFNTAGQMVLRDAPKANETQIKVSALPAGVYIVKIQNGKETISKKIIVK